MALRSRRFLPPLLTCTVALCTALTLTACSSDSTSTSSASQSASENSGESITVEHAFGSTTIQGRPERVATVGWANQEVPLALGIVPVGMPKTQWGDDDSDGLLPWVKDKIDELGGETPILFDETDSIDFEAVANSQPDVILAAYSGITQEDYDRLSQIAPTIAYPKTAWGTDLDDMITVNARGLNRAEEGEKLLKEVKSTIASDMDKHPSLKGKKIIVSGSVGTDLSKISFYTTHDPRLNFLLNAGFEAPKIVTEKSKDTEKYAESVSAENPDEFSDVDAIITYGSDKDEENKATLKRLQEDPLWSQIPAVKKGHVIFLGKGPLSASVNPSPLSIAWGFNDYLSTIEEGLKS